MIRLAILSVFFLIISCSTDAVGNYDNLKDAITEKQIVLDNIIACAASTADDNSAISVFFYPRSGATNFQYFETENVDVDKNDFSSYKQVIFPITDVFNGTLKKFNVVSETEKWVIVSYEEDGKTHLSNPIRLKQISKPTEQLNQNITTDTATIMPIFSWVDGEYSDTAIYFQVISDMENNLYSGTYTYEQSFQYYNTENVVLNITNGTPPSLETQTLYGFTLMAVSEDNWVNLFAETSFRIE